MKKYIITAIILALGCSSCHHFHGAFGWSGHHSHGFISSHGHGHYGGHGHFGGHRGFHRH